MMAKKMKDSAHDMLEAFRVFDCEGKGYIAAAELKSLMLNIGERLTPSEINEIMRDVDNADGLLNFHGKFHDNIFTGYFSRGVVMMK